MIPDNSLITFFDKHDQAEKAIVLLEEKGFDMKKLSIIGSNFYSTENIVGFYNVGDRMKEWATFGAFWGGFWGLLFGAAAFFVPGIGPIIVAGPLAALMVAAEGAVAMAGAGAIGAALVSIGIPHHKVLKYETEIKAGKFMLVAQGSDKEIEHAREILQLHVPKEKFGESHPKQSRITF